MSEAQHASAAQVTFTATSLKSNMYPQKTDLEHARSTSVYWKPRDEQIQLLHREGVVIASDDFVLPMEAIGHERPRRFPVSGMHRNILHYIQTPNRMTKSI